jgi:four helix bundle protein
VFHLADAMVIEIYRATSRFPDSERFGLQGQLRRAAVSVATNIVEGSSRPTTREYCRFLYVAHGSARECEYLVDLAGRLEMLPSESRASLADSVAHVAASLLALVRSLDDSPPSPRSTRAPFTTDPSP